jgi:uncharacterized protein YceH (UPF0502 family)
LGVVSVVVKKKPEKKEEKYHALVSAEPKKASVGVTSKQTRRAQGQLRQTAGDSEREVK